MCGIFAVFGHGGDTQAFRDRALTLSKKIRHRGPDWSGIKCVGRNFFCHERLAIVGLGSGAQPLTTPDESIILCVNGEIYNHKALRKQLKGSYEFQTESDCEVIMYLYQELGEDFVHLLDGMFSFVLYDARNDRYMVARDPIGITTLYQGWSGKDGSVWVASEMKALNEDCDRIVAFPPGHVYSSVTGKTTRYYSPSWWDPKVVPSDQGAEYDLVKLRESLERAVKKRLMTEVPYGVLLSGGLDSSLIASIAARVTRRAPASATGDDVDAAVQAAAEWPVLHSFSIGLPGSPDLAAAERVAEFIGTKHRGFTFTVQEGLDALADVIYHLETYDVTTIRASTPMYLLSRKIKAMGVKMVLSGEGSDEVFGGYLYFHQAPSDQEFHAECVTRVANLHTADCLRANKSTMAWGLEARVPFLDREFLDVAMTTDPRHKRCALDEGGRMEKYLVRKAFDTPNDPYLPHDILWRQKEQFSDGVGYSWIDTLRDHAERAVSDEKWRARAVRFPHDTPTTREAYYYREIFHRHFPQRACVDSVVRWVPRLDWGCSEDPSGRAQAAHEKAYHAQHPGSPAKRAAAGGAAAASPKKAKH
ncbi:asparagine synthetase [Blastocladiella emersonii ATCC 22665]|nr:asparagine synthetase [Blastocladiella emersonii ATCC 22665]